MRTYNTNGAIKDKEDYRDIPAKAILPRVSIPSKVITDMTGIPHWDQGQQGECVPNSHWKYVQAKLFWAAGKLVDFSPRFAYALDKQTDGSPSIEGTYRRTDDKNAATYGCVTKGDLDSNTYVSFQNYITIPRTDVLLRKAAEYVQAEGYLHVDPYGADIKQALISSKLLAVTIRCGESWFPGISPLPVPKENSWHGILIYGAETMSDGKTKCYVFNSWGPEWGDDGNGWFILEDYVKSASIADIRAYYDVPQEIIDEVKRLPAEPRYHFAANMSLGSRGPDVMALQDCLKSLGMFPLTVPSTGYYGFTTASAVLKFQIFFNIKPYFELFGLGGFWTGPATLPALNAVFDKPMPVTSKIDAWCDAIAKMENARPGWHNRGNLKYVGQAGVVAVYDLKNDKIYNTGLSLYIGKGYFCIFSDDATGAAALKNMLINACQGHSSNYQPTETLYEFYAGIETPNRFGKQIWGFAPESDNNTPNRYAEFVAKDIGVEPNIEIKKLL